MNYPQSEDKKIQKLTNILLKDVDQKGIEFSFGGNEIYPIETLSDFGGLSLFLIEAKEIYEKIHNNLFTVSELMEGLGKQIKEPTEQQLKEEDNYLQSRPIDKKFPVRFIKKEEETFFGFVPQTIDSLGDFLALTFYTHFALEQYLKYYEKNKMLLIDGKIPLEPLYDKMALKINNRQIEVLPTMEIAPNKNPNQ